MEILERIWEILSGIFGGFLRGFERGITGLFGSSNARFVKKLQSKVDSIADWEPKLEKLSDDELAQQTQKFRERLEAGETVDDIMIEAFATVREAGKRFLGMRHYDVQMIGGMVLHSGNVAEMVTGEGKTLVATLPAYLNSLPQKGCHVITVNDYLARRDMEWMGPLYMGLGLTVGAIQSDMPAAGRQKAYACDITYGTNNEFGFDYLRDNMRPAARGDDRFPPRYQQSQGPLAYAIIDEVDNILIDEARTPLIISGPAHQDPRKYAEADRIARSLKKEEHFTVSEKDHTATLTDEGVRQAEKMAGVESFYTAGNMDWPHLIDNALKAHNLYKVDVNYVIENGKIVIIDEFTGRKMEGRQWSDGLHQAVEAKEGVKIKEETQTLATITLQNYFKLYEKICGMTGTAMTEANEFWKIYNLEVIAIPTNREMERIEHPDRNNTTQQYKWKAVAEEVDNYSRWDIVFLKSDEDFVAGTIKSESDGEVVIVDKDGGKKQTISRNEISSVQYRGRPVLVGTVSIEKSEVLSEMLTKRGVKHEVLNAKNHKREAEIVAQAGRKGGVTIATNMAGRGTDIVLGGNPETMAWAQLQDKYPTRLDVPREEWDELIDKIDVEYKMSEQGEEVKKLGGLHVVGTERHDARRIDLQLRGRCGRQGDPGSSRFFLSLDDDLMRIFAGPFVKRMMEIGGVKEDHPLTSGMVSRRIDSAQKKREEFNFEIRKNLLEYDEVMDEQRKRIYAFRQKILDGTSCREVVLDMIENEIENRLATLLDENFGAESFASFASKRLSTQLDAKLFRKLDFKAADEVALDEAERNAEGEILAKIEENLPEEEEESDWNWEALTRFANVNWDLNLRDKDLIKIGRDRVDEFLVDKARGAIKNIDLTEGAPMLEADYNLKMASLWIKAKFGIEIDASDLADDDQAQVKRFVLEKAIEKYDEKEAEYPVMAGMYRFAKSGQGQPKIDREGLIAWATTRFEAQLSLDDLKNKQRDEIREMLVGHSKLRQASAQKVMNQLADKVATLSGQGQVPLRGGNGAIGSLSDWMKSNANYELDAKQVDNLEEDELKSKLESIVADYYHPEMRRMERMVLLDVVDSAWKDHLLAMDYLLAAVRQRGMASLDPKVEYKREGMRMFEGLWNSIDERVTDLIFRMEHLNEEFVSDTWVETSAVHEEAATSAEMAQQQDVIDQGTGGERKIETIRNRQQKVGRNDPCPCGSGRKFKQCCMRKDRIA